MNSNKRKLAKRMNLGDFKNNSSKKKKIMKPKTQLIKLLLKMRSRKNQEREITARHLSRNREKEKMMVKNAKREFDLFVNNS